MGATKATGLLASGGLGAAAGARGVCSSCGGALGTLREKVSITGGRGALGSSVGLTAPTGGPTAVATASGTGFGDSGLCAAAGRIGVGSVSASGLGKLRGAVTLAAANGALAASTAGEGATVAGRTVAGSPGLAGASATLGRGFSCAAELGGLGNEPVCAGAVTTLIAGAASGVAGFAAAITAASRGFPGFAASALCLAANDAGSGGGAVLASTRRTKTASGGFALGVATPITLAFTGAIGASATTGVLAAISWLTRTDSFATGLDCTNAAVGTATTAPWTSWLT